MLILSCHGYFIPCYTRRHTPCNNNLRTNQDLSIDIIGRFFFHVWTKTEIENEEVLDTLRFSIFVQIFVNVILNVKTANFTSESS